MATYHLGVVNRVTDFNNKPDVKSTLRQFVHHNASSFPGFSGAPLFLPNGHVVAINNSAREYKAERFSYGIRIDCLWELLVFHELDKLVPVGRNREEVLVDRYFMRDLAAERLRRARTLTLEAWDLFAQGEQVTDVIEGGKLTLGGVLKFSRQKQALEKCEEAIRLASYYSAPYLARLRIHLNRFDVLYWLELLYRMTPFWDRPGGSPPDFDPVAAHDSLLADVQKYRELAPSEAEGVVASVDAELLFIKWTSKGDDPRQLQIYTELDKTLTRLLEFPNLSAEDRAKALSHRHMVQERLVR